MVVMVSWYVCTHGNSWYVSSWVLMVIIVRIHRAHGNHGTDLHRAELYHTKPHGGILGSHGIHGNPHDVMVIRVLLTPCISGRLGIHGNLMVLMVLWYGTTV